MAPPQYTCSEVFVNFKSVLGKGSFGTVYKGRLHGQDVAVKVIYNDNDSSVKEMKRMSRASNHDSILKLLGTVPPCNHYNGTCHKQTRDTTWLITEYMPHGSLLSYMTGYVGGIPAQGMIKIAYQVARGMDHLHRFRNIIHSDLAARNVFVKNNNFHVKIGDFGLCQDYSYSGHYYDGEDGYMCPIRWMPPELHPYYRTPDKKCSRKGDVWSFGVLLFELWSRAKFPFNGMEDKEVMEYVNDGNTVLDYQEIKARRWVIDLMRECFTFEKDERPNFRRIYTTIEEESEYSLESGDDESESDYYCNSAY